MSPALRLLPGLPLLAVLLVASPRLLAYDRIAALGESSFNSEADSNPVRGMLIEVVRAMDRATHTTTRIMPMPFARALRETAAGHADFELPLIQNGDEPPPPGLQYVTEADFGVAYFVVYSRKSAPLDGKTVADAGHVEVEPGHAHFFPFAVTETHCLPCSLDKVVAGRTSALIASSDVIDPLLTDPRYKVIHRALYKTYPVRALVPVDKDSTATRQYLVDGVNRIKASGELARITGHDASYSDWQP